MDYFLKCEFETIPNVSDWWSFMVLWLMLMVLVVVVAKVMMVMVLMIDDADEDDDCDDGNNCDILMMIGDVGDCDDIYGNDYGEKM